MTSTAAPVPPEVLHVACVGLMAAGKSSVGRRVASELRWAFVDVDDEIEARTGSTVAELAERGGEDAYRPLERTVVLETLGRPDHSVLAAPGGVVQDAQARAALEGSGVVVVYLRADPETLARRVTEDQERHPRPLVGDDPLGVLRQMFEERDATYRSLADLEVQVGARTHDEVAQLVLDTLTGVVVRPPRAAP